MEYTNQPPTKDGYYWAKDLYGSEEEIVKVVGDFVLSVGCDSSDPDSIQDFGQWCGPLNKPEA